jgi:hypothetical protein
MPPVRLLSATDRPSFHIAHINMENAGVRFSRNGFFEEGLAGNQVNPAEDVLSAINLGGRLKQRKHDGEATGPPR